MALLVVCYPVFLHLTSKMEVEVHKLVSFKALVLSKPSKEELIKRLNTIFELQDVVMFNSLDKEYSRI